MTAWNTITPYVQDQVIEYTDLNELGANLRHVHDGGERVFVAQFTSAFSAAAGNVSPTTITGFELVVPAASVCGAATRGLLLASFSARSAGSAQPFEYYFRVNAFDWLAGFSNQVNYHPVNMFYVVDDILNTANAAYWTAGNLTIRIGVKTLGTVVNCEIPATSFPQIALLEV